MGKYPPIKYQIIDVCVDLICVNKFDTYCFIKIWKALYPDDASNFESIGTGWRSVVGKNLSEYAKSTERISATKKKRNNGEVWKKQ